MLHLLLVRHGETALNAAKRFQGHVDPPLTERGRGQAAALAPLLNERTIDAIYASDLRRAVETAEIIRRGHDRLFTQSSLLRELSFGEWEGLTYDEIRQRDGDLLERWTRDRFNTLPPGGESVRQLHDRITRFMDELKSRHAGQTVLLVAHGGTLQVLLPASLGLSPAAFWQFRLEHASLSELSLYDEGAILNRLNVVGTPASEPPQGK